MTPLDIELVDVAYAHPGTPLLFSRLSLRIGSGWTGIVGANGAGKTTLLRLLAGELLPDAGCVHRPGARRVAVCPQRVERCDASIAGFARAQDRAAARLRGRLALDALDLPRWESLSPGERKRWQIGAALAAEPHALLLDEPTNHLDPEARALLVAALAAHRGIGVLVSHDRDLLGELTRTTVRVHAGDARVYRGSYAEAKRTWEAEAAHAAKLAGALRSERAHLSERMTETRARRDHADARTRTRSRMKGPRDNATAGGLKMARRRSAVNALGREIRKLHGRIERIDREAARFRFEKEIGRSVFVDWSPAPVPEIARLETDRLAVGAGVAQRTLLHDVRAVLRRDDRIWLCGPNGSGKTTLLSRLLAGARIPADRLLCLPQELDEAAGIAALARARALPTDARGRLLQRVAALGVDPDALLASPRPSPGEARKLVLADALARQVWALALDEPTHHLDLPSLERLEQALSEYPGALLFVSHDETFARRLARARWRIADGRLHEDALPPPSQPGGQMFR